MDKAQVKKESAQAFGLILWYTLDYGFKAYRGLKRNYDDIKKKAHLEMAEIKRTINSRGGGDIEFKEIRDDHWTAEDINIQIVRYDIE